MSKRRQALLLAAMGAALSAQANQGDFYEINKLPDLGEIYHNLFISEPNPIFIPRKHTKMKYADHKRIKAKRKNKR